MDRYNYIITVDENGSPSLEHALLGNKKGSQKKDHKYIDRVLDKAGKWRYFYTQEEARAYANKGKKIAKSVVKEAKRFGKDFKKDPKKAFTNAFDRANKAIDRAEQRSFITNDPAVNEAKFRIRQAKSAVKATGRVISEMAKEAVKPFNRKKKQAVNNIHEKFKDVTLDAIGPIVDPKGNEARKNLKYANSDNPNALSKALFGLFLGRAINESEYKHSKLGAIERFLDSPIAELHNQKYQEYSWKAGTTGFDKPKEIAENAKKAWNERVKRDRARAKSMKRRGVSPQTLLH